MNEDMKKVALQDDELGQVAGGNYHPLSMKVQCSNPECQKQFLVDVNKDSTKCPYCKTVISIKG